MTIQEVTETVYSEIQKDGTLIEHVQTAAMDGDRMVGRPSIRYRSISPDGKAKWNDGTDAGEVKDLRSMTKALHNAIPQELKDAYAAKVAAEKQAIEDAKAAEGT